MMEIDGDHDGVWSKQNNQQMFELNGISKIRLDDSESTLAMRWDGIFIGPTPVNYWKIAK